MSSLFLALGFTALRSYFLFFDFFAGDGPASLAVGAGWEQSEELLENSEPSYFAELTIVETSCASISSSG